MTPLVESSLEALETCSTQTEYYRVALELMKHATPNDIVALREANQKPNFASWLDCQHEMLTKENPNVTAYDLAYRDEAKSLYSEGPGRDCLVIGFSGRADMLMLPTPWLLQFFSPNCDVLVLRDRSKMGFAAGIKGYADDFVEMLHTLQRDFDFARYREIRCFGTSSGGVAALAAGVVLDAAKAVSVSGHYLTDSVRSHGERPHKIEEIIRTSSGSSERFVTIYGAGNERDTQNAEEIARTFAMRLYPVRGVKSHAVITTLHKQGRLNRAFNRMGLNG